MTKKITEIHPGTILNEEFMRPMELSSADLAGKLNLPESHINSIVNKAHPITNETAMCLAEFFKMESQFWINLQAEYDIRTGVTK